MFGFIGKRRLVELSRKRNKFNNSLEAEPEIYLVGWSSLAFLELWFHYTHGRPCHCTSRIQMRGDTALVHIYRLLYIQGRRVRALQYHASLRRTDVHGDSEVTCLLKKSITFIKTESVVINVKWRMGQKLNASSRRPLQVIFLRRKTSNRVRVNRSTIIRVGSAG